MLEFNAAVEVVPNALDEGLWFRGRRSGELHPRTSADRLVSEAGRDVIRILYYGTRTHEGDLDLVRPALERFENEFPGRVQLTVAGGVPRSSEATWFTRLDIPSGSTHYPSFVKWIREIAPDFDFAIAPLVDDPFNRSKSDLKYLEYAALGLPGIYSDVAAYGSVESGITGLVARDESDWLEAFGQIVGDSALRGELRRNAFDYVRRNRTLGRSVAAYLELLLSVAKASSPD
jgi:glycosyltransferase involved in cell wall biosynthesis